jgi:hypothetical protein
MPFRECAQSPCVLIVKSGDFRAESDEGDGLKNRCRFERKSWTRSSAARTRRKSGCVIGPAVAGHTRHRERSTMQAARRAAARRLDPGHARGGNRPGDRCAAYPSPGDLPENRQRKASHRFTIVRARAARRRNQAAVLIHCMLTRTFTSSASAKQGSSFGSLGAKPEYCGSNSASTWSPPDANGCAVPPP